MGRRIKGMMAACAVALLGSSFGSVFAAGVSTPYIAEQAKGKAPNIAVYMTGSKIGKDAKVSAEMEGIPFAMDGDAVSFEKSREAISYIILMDNSGSVNQEQFEETKNQLAKLRNSLKPGDEMALYTVGTDNPGGEKTEVFQRAVTAKDKKAQKNDCKKIAAIEYLRGVESKTVLYRSLNQVLKEQAAPRIRTVVLVITDGEDDSQGKDIDHVSTAQTVKEASVPVYGIMLNRKPSKSKPDAGQDEKISYTRNEILAEKNSRGYYHDCSVDATPESVQEAFETIRKILNQETYVVHLKAPTNQAPGKGALKLTVDNSSVGAIEVDYSDYEEDKNAPNLTGDIQEVSSNSITFSIQDKNGVNIQDANETSNYIIQSVTEKEDGKIWAVESVNAVAKGNEVAVTLTIAEEFYNDTYTLHCTNIRDQSQEKNKMDVTGEFSIETGLDAKKVAMEETLKSFWWIGLVALVLIIGIVLILIIRKKKAETVGIVPEELEKADTKKIRLTITDRAGIIKDVEWNVEGSLFVGRSDICNIYFDDDRLSKQHFVVEVNKMGCYIEDLESTNGTFVNGVKITNRRMLLDGDVITAGREKMVFHLPKQEILEDANE